MLDRTITQNNALYLAQHRTFKERKSLFGYWRTRAKDSGPTFPQPAFSEAYLVPRFFHNNGR